MTTKITIATANKKSIQRLELIQGSPPSVAIETINEHRTEADLTPEGCAMIAQAIRTGLHLDTYLSATVGDLCVETGPSGCDINIQNDEGHGQYIMSFGRHVAHTGVSYTEGAEAECAEAFARPFDLLAAS